MDDTERSRDRAPDLLVRPQPTASRRRADRRDYPPPPPQHWLITALLVLVLCVATMAIATVVLRQWRPGPLAPIDTSGAPQDSARAAAHQQFVAGDEFERQARLKAQQEEDQRRAAAVKQHDAEEAAARRSAAAQAQHERDWQNYYKKPAWCDPALPNIDSVGCANDYIRARRAFDAQSSAARPR